MAVILNIIKKMFDFEFKGIDLVYSQSIDDTFNSNDRWIQKYILYFTEMFLGIPWAVSKEVDNVYLKQITKILLTSCVSCLAYRIWSKKGLPMIETRCANGLEFEHGKYGLDFSRADNRLID